MTERELNRALLARQGLLDRATSPIPRMLERVGGLQTQYAPSGYVGLWSRLDGLERADLTRALERRVVVQATVLRSTIHMVSSRDYYPLLEAIRRERRSWWLRVARRDATAAALEDAARRIRELLADGPRRRVEIMKELGLDTPTWNGAGLWVDLVRVPPSGTWEQRRADRYAAAEDWLGPSTATFDEGLDLVVRRYLGAFGPGSRKDIATWAGLAPSTLAPAIDRLKLRRFRDERGDELLDLPRAPLPSADTPSPPRFLPTWDATLLVHARRTQILPEAYRPRIFNTKTPHSVNTFLIDGRVAGTWREERGRIRASPFARISREDRRVLDEEAERLAAFMA